MTRSAASPRPAGKRRPTRPWLRRRTEQLAAIERPSASEGELEAARWLVAALAEQGTEARIESERAHGTYWWPLGIGAAAGTVAGLASLRGGRLGRAIGALLGGLAAAAIADEYPPRRRRLRGLLPQRPTHNVVCELGPEDARRTIVVVAHHDAAHAGLLFHPAVPAWLSQRFPRQWERANTSPAMMWPVVGGPAAVGLGSLLGIRSLVRLGTLLSAGALPVFADIGLRPAVPGANDNATAVVALVALARALVALPTESTRVILLSTGSEESFSEGMKAFGERHFPRLSRQDTFFLCLDTLGSPHLNVLRGEGFLRMYEYPPEALELIDGLADELGIWLYPNLRLRNGTDGLESLAAGYPTVSLCSCTDYKVPANYHWPTDTAENVDYDTLSDAIRLSEAVIRRLDERWL